MSFDFSQYDPNDDASMMQAVLALATQGQNSTQPNPMVGCVLVRDGQIVGSGWHQKAGELHAERLALAEAGENARGAIAYVNLEPCCHQGRTPPCTDGLIDAGVVRVVSAMRDPNPLVEGGGYELLTGAGIEVQSELLGEPARWLNRGFISRMQRQQPWVVLKSAATLDGRTAAFDGESKWITSQAARDQVQSLRAASSAVLTGIGTVLADDPQLNVRSNSIDVVRQPLRVVLDTNLRCPLDARIIGDDHQCLILTASDDVEKTAALIENGAEVVNVGVDGQILPQEVLAELGRWQCNEVLIEAGQTVAGSFVNAGLVDEMALFYASSILGDQGRSMFKFDQAFNFGERPEYRIRDVAMVAEDILVTAVNPQSVDSLASPA